MIILPSSPAPGPTVPREIDFGILQRPGTGAAATYIDRPGLRLAADFTFPPMPAEVAMVYVSRLMRAKKQGLRIPWPLAGVDQGSPGNPVVNGGGAAGTSLPVRSASPGYQIKEGWWLNVVDSSGAHSLHNVTAVGALVGGSGTVSVWPPLRSSLVDGNLVVFDAPKMEGIVTSEISWSVGTDHNVTLSFTIEETA